MRNRFLTLFLLLVAGSALGQPPAALLRIENAPEHGLVIADVNLKEAFPDIAGPNFSLQAVSAGDGTAIPVQWVPGPSDNPEDCLRGTIVTKLPKGGDYDLRLQCASGEMPSGVLEGNVVKTAHAEIGFDPVRVSGMLSSIVFLKTGKRFDTFTWNDRLYDKEEGQAWLRYDKEAKSEVISEEPLCTVVRFKAKYCLPDGNQPDSKPRATYDWYVFKDLPLIFVRADVQQDKDFIWQELHMLECNFPDESFTHWAGGEPLKSGDFTGKKESIRCSNWGALIDGTNALGLFGTGVIFYDGRGEYGTYMHGPWQPWTSKEGKFSSWLWIGDSEHPDLGAQAAAVDFTKKAKVVLTTEGLRAEIAKQWKAARGLVEGERGDALWHVCVAEKLEERGQLAAAALAASGQWPEGWVTTDSGALKLAFEVTQGGLEAASLFDSATGTEFLGTKKAPFFTLFLQHIADKTKCEINASSGWDHTSVRRNEDQLLLGWESPNDSRLSGLTVEVTPVSDPANNAWKWTIKVEGLNPEWTLTDVIFPQVSLAEWSSNQEVLFPRGPGEVRKDVCREAFTYRCRYPSGWGSMQFMAAYSPQPATGLYVGVHDPMGSTKEIVLESDPASQTVRLAYENPAPDTGKPGNAFSFSGEAVWQLLRGDWFDATCIYKRWVVANAKWWPKLGKDGREDTPMWTRELCAWAQTGGAPQECTQKVIDFAKDLEVPTGFHWYNWHQIPFDNDYPHYFPTKEGFREAVAQLQQSNVFVMPYINGRLWDTRDKGMEDFEFTSKALPAVTKDTDGKPFTESYGSKESDGSPVKLGVMCPTTPLWQQTVKDIVLRIQNEEGTKAVYIDQIAAASPVLCMDTQHGHPLGGGCWWNEGYWKLLEGLRSEMQKDRMITTECNGEPFIAWMDGYLTWHWQNDGQVPAFPAVYGGAVQMFGRAYGGGDTRELALRMKAGQQLVFGEQIGWLDPSLVKEADTTGFFKKAVQLRHYLRRYFYAGEMARPPKFTAEVPKVKADWQWSGEWWVTTDAILTGAWRIPAEGKTVLIFANVSAEPVNASLKLNGSELGIPATGQQAVVLRDPKLPGEPVTLPATGEYPMTFSPCEVLAIEFRVAP